MTAGVEKSFDTSLLDRAKARRRAERERERQQLAREAIAALDALSERVSIEEAYIFGSLSKPHRFRADSDIDIAVVGISDTEYFPAAAFLSEQLRREVDLLQLENYHQADRVRAEGIQWTKKR